MTFLVIDINSYIIKVFRMCIKIVNRPSKESVLRFSSMKEINTEKSEVHNKITRTVRDAAMLLRLLRIIMDAMKFCAFQKFKRTEDKWEEVLGMTISFWEVGTLTSEDWLVNWKSNINMSYISRKSSTDCSHPEVFFLC